MIGLYLKLLTEIEQKRGINGILLHVFGSLHFLFFHFFSPSTYPVNLNLSVAAQM